MQLLPLEVTPPTDMRCIRCVTEIYKFSSTSQSPRNHAFISHVISDAYKSVRADNMGRQDKCGGIVAVSFV